MPRRRRFKRAKKIVLDVATENLRRRVVQGKKAQPDDSAEKYE